MCDTVYNIRYTYVLNDIITLQGRIKEEANYRPWPIGPRDFTGPALSKIKEMCRHSDSLSHENSEKMFWIVTCFMYPRVFTKEGSCSD